MPQRFSLPISGSSRATDRPGHHTPGHSSLLHDDAEGPLLERDPGMPATTWRLRSDAWEYLRYTLKQLVSAQKHGADEITTETVTELRRTIRVLYTMELYWAGFGQRYVERIAELIEDGELQLALDRLGRVVHRLRGEALNDEHLDEAYDDLDVSYDHDPRPRFEVLVVDQTTPADRDQMQDELLRLRGDADDFIYEYVIVPSAEDAVAAVLTNPNILAVVLRPGFEDRSTQKLSVDLKHTIGLAFEEHAFTDDASGTNMNSVRRVLKLGDVLAGLRPELDQYFVAGAHIEDLAGTLTRRFRRVFRREDRLELHLSLLRRIGHMYETPFFEAIQHHARRPAGVFHALPISRGGSVLSSKWIRDLGEFYGMNLLLAETSATSGGLDSLLAPTHTLRKTQDLAARAFHAQHTFFVTNGTSTANKIVHQALVSPGDVVLVDRNCHKSHHYALMLSGGRPAYLDAYPLNQYGFYGAVPLSKIKQLLLDYRAARRLDEVRMVTLTNCTFDGVVYDPERVMAECLAIKPDLVFLWDEAWFAFAAFHPVTRRRTAMAAAKRLERLLASNRHRQAYEEQRKKLFNEDGSPAPDEVWQSERLLPPPTARLRVYSTQSTHKTLTALRQGSMIHIHDQDYARESEEAFHEAYMTHTSTSPNYQILASLDLGRRQVELEGFELVQRQLDMAVSLQNSIARHPLLRRTFKVLGAEQLVPSEYRAEDSKSMPLRHGLSDMWHAWANDEFVIDPSRITVEITRTGVDGDTFKHDYLMDQYGIQVNKTSRNTVLFMTNIGTSRSSIAYLIEVLVKLAEKFERRHSERGLTLEEVEARIEQTPPLPDFSYFDDEFAESDELPDGDLRTAYYRGQRTSNVKHVLGEELRTLIHAGYKPVSAGYVTPYPPGFPVLVPGQVVTRDVVEFMAALDTREIHGYTPGHGYRILASSLPETAGKPVK